MKYENLVSPYHYQYTSKAAVINLIILSRLTCHVTDVLQTAGTEVISLLEFDRQRVAGGDWVTARTYTFASHGWSQFDCPSIVHISSSTFHDFHSVVGPVTMW
jgi:hypothetical protein